MNEDCIFCNPAPETLVYKGDDGIIVLDYPARPGHVLIGVKGHFPNLDEVPLDEISDMMKLAVRTSKKIVEETGAEKTYVVSIGDKDPHFHIHLIPKMSTDPSLGPPVFSGDGWASFLPADVDQAELTRIKDILGAFLS